MDNGRLKDIAAARGVEVLVDIRTSELRLSEVMGMIEDYKLANPDREVWLDGDLYAVVSMPRGAEA